MLSCGCEKDRMLMDISILDFAIVELTEYLDTHPHDKQAISYLMHYSKMCRKLTREFSERFYPLAADLSCDTEEFTWATSPMPWESAEEAEKGGDNRCGNMKKDCSFL